MTFAWTSFSSVFAAGTAATVVLFALVFARALGRQFGLGILGIAGGWMAITGTVASTGFLVDFTLPPKFLVVIVPSLIGVFVLARKDWALKTPWVVLVGLQAFRIGVEILIHAAVTREISPPQLTWTGLNLDVLTGLTAPLVAWGAHTGRIGRRGLWAWNIFGAALLAIVVVVAFLSTPTPFQVFTPDNLWVVHAPYVWLPCILVSFALWLHVLSFCKLLNEAREG